MLSDKRKRFCEEYVKDLNAAKAAIRAGYAEDHARQTAHNILVLPEAEEYIAILQESTAKRNEITIDELIHDLIEINNINMADFYDKEGKLKNISDLPKEFTRCIQEIQLTKAGTKYKFYSRTDAIEKLAKHLGFYEKDNKQSKPEVNIHLPYDIKIESREKADPK